MNEYEDTGSKVGRAFLMGWRTGREHSFTFAHLWDNVALFVALTWVKESMGLDWM